MVGPAHAPLELIEQRQVDSGLIVAVRVRWWRLCFRICLEVATVAVVVDVWNDRRLNATHVNKTTEFIIVKLELSNVGIKGLYIAFKKSRQLELNMRL